AQTYSRKSRAALDPERPWPPRGAGSLGVFGPFHQARRPVHAPLCDRTPDGGGGVPARNHRRADRTDCEPGRLRDSGGVFKTVPSVSRPIAWPVPSSATLWQRQKTKGSSGSRSSRLILTQPKLVPVCRTSSCVAARTRHSLGYTVRAI